jgi:prepilin-type N-terminal cleavage/methylation domain-containing protein
MKQKGFTIPELLVAVFVFSLVIGGAANLFLVGIAAQRNSLARQELLDQSSSVAEYMSRALRQATKDVFGTCLLQAGSNYEITLEEGVKFLDIQGNCHEFFLEDLKIKERLLLQTT